MFSRGLVALVFLAVLAFANAESQPLSEEELTEFLGPGKVSLMTWRVATALDFVVYYGDAKPPLSGGVGIYLGGWPSPEFDPSSTIVRGQLGIFPVKWRRAVLPKGGIRQEAVISVDDDGYWKAHVWLEAKQQGDLDKLLGELSQLPTFSAKHRSPFHGEIVRERRARGGGCLLACIFGCSIWLLDRKIRRRKGSTLRRGLALAGISLGWLILFVGLAQLAFSVLGDAINFYAIRWGFLIMLAPAAIGLIVGLLVASVSWFLGRRPA